MKLTAKIKLQPAPEQHALLLQTLERANNACNYVSELAWEHQIFQQYPLHHLAYKDIRADFGLAAQVAVRTIGKVADAYKLDRKVQRVFDSLGAFPYDDRILTINPDQQMISIWTLEGRQKMAYLAGERQQQLLQAERGESDLCYIDGEFYLFVACEVETPEPSDVDEFLGVDLGIVNIASDSDGEVYSGDAVNENSRRFQYRRRNLQRKGTHSARRKLQKLSGKQSRFQKDTNHTISKRIVQKSKDTGRGIALEDLGGIRDRVTVRRQQRARHSNWSFHDLRQKIEYKAKLAGVRVVAVDPRNTSRTCPACGCVDKANRKTQSHFSCIQCGYAAPADTVAAVSIAARAAVNQPNALSVQGHGSLECSDKLPTFSR